MRFVRSAINVITLHVFPSSFFWKEVMQMFYWTTKKQQLLESNCDTKKKKIYVTVILQIKTRSVKLLAVWIIIMLQRIESSGINITIWIQRVNVKSRVR